MGARERADRWAERPRDYRWRGFHRFRRTPEAGRVLLRDGYRHARRQLGQAFALESRRMPIDTGPLPSAGQSRIQCTREDWVNQLDNLSLSSDGFIPFRDNIDRAARAGVGYVLQPGGSARDDDVIAACDEYGI